MKDNCNIYRVNADFIITETLHIQRMYPDLYLNKLISHKVNDLIDDKDLAADCKAHMHMTLKTGIPTGVTVFLRFPGNNKIILRHLCFKKHNDELLMTVWPEEETDSTVNIFILDLNCCIINLMTTSIPDPETLKGLPIKSFLSHPGEADYSQHMIRHTIRSGKQNTWCSKFQLPNTPTQKTFLKSSSFTTPTAILLTRHFN